jgi:hypothetical protein
VSTDVPKVPLGRVVATPRVLRAFEDSGDAPLLLLTRHHHGDWGELSEQDLQANEDALRHGDRLLSAYHLRNNIKIWIITEADRSSTCILLPSEY